MNQTSRYCLSGVAPRNDSGNPPQSIIARVAPEVNWFVCVSGHITPTPETARSRGEGWLDVERAAIVEVTSEDKDYPVESVFVSGQARGWRAAAPGPQTIRLVFDQPQRLKHISLVFEENETARTQEFVLRWSPDGGRSSEEIVRQQWNFSPPETTREVEEYQVELSNVTALELIIVPNISLALRSRVCACLES
jgi:hypothetical protein